jgi:WhiB family transcriptional regulator, redox-sensing transcriptional regulator
VLVARDTQPCRGRHMTEHATEWRAAGACLTADPDLFFPISTGGVGVKQVARAQQICAGCPVRQECLDFAMRSGEMHGIWGGTTPEERIRQRREQAARRRRARRSWQAPDTRVADARAQDARAS